MSKSVGLALSGQPGMAWNKNLATICALLFVSTSPERGHHCLGKEPLLLDHRDETDHYHDQERQRHVTVSQTHWHCQPRRFSRAVSPISRNRVT
eukprot:3150386-Rhodomonas_salina.1